MAHVVIEKMTGNSSYAVLFQLLFPLLAVLAAVRYLWPTITTGSKQQPPLPPSPPGLPIIGHLHLIGKDPHVSLRDLAEKHAAAGLMLLRLGSVPNLVVSSARAAEAIMRTHDHVFASRPHSAVMEVLLQGSVDVAFAPCGEWWRQSRKLVTTHLLSANKVRSLHHARHHQVGLAIAKIYEAAATHAAVDMSDLLYSFTNDILCRAVSGKFFRVEGRNKLFQELIEANMTLVDGFKVADYFPSLARFDVLSRVVCARAKKVQERWHELLDKLIDDHASKSVHLSQNNEQVEEVDFIDVLLSRQPEYGLTRKHMKAILMDMFGAGTDTSYIAMEFAIAELMRNPDIMNKLQAEVRMNTPKRQEMVMVENLGDMTYLKAVVKETLRLHPPAPLLLPHLSVADCNIDGYLIPAQTRVIINVWAISRDLRSWDRADKFMPERFMTGSSLGIDFKGNDFQFTPFGAGRRICPGINFSLATIEIMLANLIYCFDWELPTGMQKEDLDMTEVFGLTMRRKEKLFLVPKPFGV